jgi:hypothetical protein
MMKLIEKNFVAALLAASLIVAPGFAAQQGQTAGVVLDANQAQVGSAPISQGASLFAGDVVSTDSEGHAQLRVRKTRFELIGQSHGAFFAGANRAIAILRHGTLVVALSDPSETFEIFASDVRIVPKPGTVGPYFAQVTMNSDCDLQVKVQKGTLEATAGKETKELDEDHAYDVIPEVSVDDKRDPAVSPEESGFHQGHGHATCPAWAKWDAKPANPGLSPHFKIIAGAAAAAILVPILIHTTTGPGNAPESPFKP